MITEINRDELWQKLNHPKKSVLLEALPAEEYRQGHLPGALNLPPEEVPTLATELLPRKDVEVIVYCAGADCDASERVGAELMNMGFSNVRRYVGGKRDWIEAGLPTVADEAAA